MPVRTSMLQSTCIGIGIGRSVGAVGSSRVVGSAGHQSVRPSVARYPVIVSGRYAGSTSFSMR